MTSYPFLKMATTTAKYYFRFRICWCHCLQNVKSISKPNFIEISQLAPETYLLPILKNKRPTYWNSTSGFDLDHFAVIGVLFCIMLPNFVQIGTSTAEIWRHIDFQDCGCQPAMLYLLWGNGGPLTKCRSWSELGHSLFVGLIVPKILWFIDFRVLAWNWLFTPLFGGVFGATALRRYTNLIIIIIIYYYYYYYTLLHEITQVTNNKCGTE